MRVSVIPPRNIDQGQLVALHCLAGDAVLIAPGQGQLEV